MKGLRPTAEIVVAAMLAAGLAACLMGPPEVSTGLRMEGYQWVYVGDDSVRLERVRTRDPFRELQAKMDGLDDGSRWLGLWH